MQERILRIKGAITLMVTAIAELLGWKGIFIFAWVGAMAIDYISGSMAARRAGEWSSRIARDGIWHKGGMILVVLECAILDLVAAVLCEHVEMGISWPGIVMPLALVWYIITECGSILENAEKMGAPVPKWLIRLLKTGIQAVEKSGEKIGEDRETEEI